jgi:hypothetical protein
MLAEIASVNSFAGESGETDSPYNGIRNEAITASPFQETRLQKKTTFNIIYIYVS